MAGLNCISVWEIPEGRDKVNSRLKQQDDTAARKPTLLHNCDFIFPGIGTLETTRYNSNSSVDTTSHLRTVNRTSSIGNSKSQIGGHAPSIKSIEWHHSAVPTLLAFSTICDPIKIVLPRMKAGVEVSSILCSSSQQGRALDTSVQVIGSEDLPSLPETTSPVQTGPRETAPAPRVHPFGEAAAAPRVHPFGGASVKSNIVIAVDSIGSVIVLLDPVNDSPKMIKPSCSLESVRNRRVKAVCLSGDDSVVCIAYSVSSTSTSTSAGTAFLLSPCKDLLSIKSLHEAISTSHHGSSSRSSSGFRHILAGTSLRDAIHVPSRTNPGTSSMPIQASSHPPVYPHVSTRGTHTPPATQDTYATISRASDAADESTPTVCVRSDSSFVSVMGSLLHIEDGQQHSRGVIEQSTSGSEVKVKESSRISFLSHHSPDGLERKLNTKHLPLDVIEGDTSSISISKGNTPGDCEAVGEVEMRWLTEPGATLLNTHCELHICESTHNNKCTAKCNEKKEKQITVAMAEIVMRVFITDPLLAQPDLLSYREHTQPLPSEPSSPLTAAVTASALPICTSHLMGYLAVGSTQSGRVVVYAIEGSFTGHSATIHHTFDLPNGQVCRFLW